MSWVKDAWKDPVWNSKRCQHWKCSLFNKKLFTLLKSKPLFYILEKTTMSIKCFVWVIFVFCLCFETVEGLSFMFWLLWWNQEPKSGGDWENLSLLGISRNSGAGECRICISVNYWVDKLVSILMTFQVVRWPQLMAGLFT